MKNGRDHFWGSHHCAGPKTFFDDIKHDHLWFYEVNLAPKVASKHGCPGRILELVFGNICLNCSKFGYFERFFGHNSKTEHLTALKP